LVNTGHSIVKDLKVQNSGDTYSANLQRGGLCLPSNFFIFIFQLGQQMTRANMENRFGRSIGLPKYVLSAIEACGVTEEAVIGETHKQLERNSKRARCYMCPRNKDLKVNCR
jgi:hypothetical protein